MKNFLESLGWHLYLLAIVVMGLVLDILFTPIAALVFVFRVVLVSVEDKMFFLEYEVARKAPKKILKRFGWYTSDD